jgi:hypothetical protein
MSKAAEMEQRVASVEARLAEVERAVGIRRPEPVVEAAAAEPAADAGAAAGEG